MLTAAVRLATDCLSQIPNGNFPKLCDANISPYFQILPNRSALLTRHSRAQKTPSSRSEPLYACDNNHLFGQSQPLIPGTFLNKLGIEQGRHRIPVPKRKPAKNRYHMSCSDAGTPKPNAPLPEHDDPNNIPPKQMKRLAPQKRLVSFSICASS